MHLPRPFVCAAALAACFPAIAQTVWLPATTATTPPAREHACMVDDSLRGRIVMHGGIDAAGGALADTWEFDGVNWQSRNTFHIPYSNGNGAMVYDRGRARVVLWYSYASASMTWEYDGLDWTNVTLPTNPPISNRNLMVYDASRGVIVMWVQGSGSLGGQTWEYDGITWTQRLTVGSPPQRYDAGMVFDPVRGRAILHGGFVYTGSAQVSWEYDGLAWTAVPSSFANPDKRDFAFAFDPYRRCAVLFGGSNFPGTPSTYEFRSPAWQLRTSVGPSSRSGAAMAYDLTREECILFGGRDTATAAVLADTYRYRALNPAIVAPFGQGCTGTSVAPGLLPQPYHRPYLGTGFGVRLYSAPFNQPSFVAAGFSRVSYAGLPLPLPLTSIGMTGCELFVSAEVTLGTAVAGSNATLTIPLPAVPALVGTHVYLQGFVFDPGANPANLVDTRALDCTLGSA